MKIRLNPLILGAFIVGAIVLAVVAFLAIGSTNIFRPTGHFVFYLPQSVQGVARGTSVNLDGVPVGQVDGVRVLFDRQSRNSWVAVICRINDNVLTDFQGHQILLTNRRELQNLVSEGLFAQVRTAGIVGAKFVELGFNPSSTPSIQAGLPPSPYPVVPTVPSTMSEVTDDISRILSNLRQTDFKGIARQVQDVLASTRLQIGELETNRLTSRISSAAASFNQFINSPDLSEAVEHIREAAANLQGLATNLNSQVRPLAANLNATLNSANDTVQTVQDFLALRNQLGQQTDALLRQFNQTARAIEQLVDFLQRHPNALIAGRAHSANSP